MNLKAWSKKLRALADAIDAVFEEPPTPALAKKIAASLATKRKKVHWTQRPKNRAKVKAMAKKRAAHRKGLV